MKASALLTFLRDEPGADVVERALEAGAAISAANWAEVSPRQLRLARPNVLAKRLQREGLLGDALQVVSLDADGPEIARLRLATRERGLSQLDA